MILDPSARIPASTPDHKPLDVDAIVRHSLYEVTHGEYFTSAMAAALEALAAEDYDDEYVERERENLLSDTRPNPMQASWNTLLADFSLDSLSILEAMGKIEERLHLEHGLKVVISEAVCTAKATLDDLRHHVANLVMIALGKQELDAVAVSELATV